MSDILKEFGPDSSQPQAGVATNGGQCVPKPIPYSSPVGLSGQMRQGPGLGGDNCGTCGTQGRR